MAEFPARTPSNSGQKAAAQQIQDALYWICEAHNLWVTQHKKGTSIKLDTLDTEDGARTAIETLRAASAI